MKMRTGMAKTYTHLYPSGVDVMGASQLNY